MHSEGCFPDAILRGNKFYIKLMSNTYWIDFFTSHRRATRSPYPSRQPTTLRLSVRVRLTRWRFGVFTLPDKISFSSGIGTFMIMTTTTSSDYKSQLRGNFEFPSITQQLSIKYHNFYFLNRPKTLAPIFPQTTD